MLGGLGIFTVVALVVMGIPGHMFVAWVSRHDNRYPFTPKMWLAWLFACPALLAAVLLLWALGATLIG